MKITATGIITVKGSSHFQNKKGEKVIKAQIFVRTESGQYGDKGVCFETIKPELIAKIKELGDKECTATGYLNGFSGTGQNGNKYFINNVNLTEISEVVVQQQQQNETEEPEVKQEEDDDLPF